MKPLTEVEIRDDDKRLAARREAAHVVVAAVYDGMLLGAQIMETGTNDILANYTWVGRTHRTVGGMEGQPALLKWRSSEDAAAGLAAECLMEDPEVMGQDCVDYVDLEVYSMPARDQALLPTDHYQRIEVFDTALTVLQENREFLEWATNELYTKEVITDSTVSEYLSRMQSRD